MDKNTVIGLLLIALLLIGYSWYTQPSQEELAQQQKQEQLQKQKTQQEQDKNAGKTAGYQGKQTAAIDSNALFAKAMQGTPEKIVLQNKKIQLTFNSKGAVVEKAVIKNFKDRKGQPDVTLFDAGTQQLNYTLTTKDGFVNTQDLVFTPSNVTDTTVTFTAEAKQGTNQALVIEYRLGNTYMLYADIKAVGLSQIIDPNANQISFNWKEKAIQQEKGHSFENRFSALTYHNAEGGTDYIGETSETIDEATEELTDWVAFKNQFFSAVMISKDGFQKGMLLSSVPQDKTSGFIKDYQAKGKTTFDPKGVNPTQLDFYFGPNDFHLLQKVQEESRFGKDLQMERLVNLGWPLFRYINRWFTLYIFDWLTGLNINMGIVLILITLLLKLITYPLVKKSFMSSAKMRVLKPKLEEATKHLNKPEDQMQKQQAMMAEYAKYGVSPLSGCLPMLIQMPIWIAMFNFVPNAIQLRGERFLWIQDLSTYDPIYEWHDPIWMIGDHLSLTCILFCAANLLYSWMTMRQQRDQMVGQQAEQMKAMMWMTYLMPLMFFFMFNDYSAGLNFYYFVSLFFSAAIMWGLRKTTNEEKLLAMLEARYKENQANPKKMSGLAARLQALQQQQAEMNKRK